MQVYLNNQQKDLSIKLDLIPQIVQSVLTIESAHTDELSIQFVSRSEICQLHEEHFDDPSPTDCISFPLDSEPASPGIHHVLGEVFVCPKTAKLYALENNTDEYDECLLYLVHGLLHLLGYDDIEDSDREKMREAEARNMQELKKQNLDLRPLNIEK
ncbi:MAG: rRNA maturation RNase YbeY [Waddliaceae bacterium]|nr:rRNA maturation RNase YbeY [Waddliaceae bacterium]